MVNPGGKSVVLPRILPETMVVNVEVEKLVVASTTAPKKLVDVNVQLLKVELDKFVPDKSSEEENVSDVYVFPWPITTMVTRLLSLTCS